MIIKLESELAKLNDIKKVIKEMGASLISMNMKK